MICKVCKEDKKYGTFQSSDFVKGKPYPSFICMECRVKEKGGKANESIQRR